MLRQYLDHLATLLHAAGITHWAISPGSRNAPIVAGMLRHGGFQLYSFPDERSAAFAALGMAQASHYPCGVICTSGTAVLNLYPAICEAYYQRVPLIALTADRPESLIDQWDGQTIHQKNIFEKHIIHSCETAQNPDENKWDAKLEKLIYTAVEKSLSPVRGPVHINVPLADPIYEGLELPFFSTEPSRPFVFLRPQLPKTDQNYLHAELLKYEKILIVAGQHIPDPHLQYELLKVSHMIPVIGDINANIQHAGIEGWEYAMSSEPAPDRLKPDLLITFGLSVTSKKLKQFLQQHKPQQHWHLSTGGFTGDPFKTNPVTRNIEPADFFSFVANFENVGTPQYHTAWKEYCTQASNKPLPLQQKYQFTEFEIVKNILKNVDATVCLQLGNSMTVRYAGWAGKTMADVFCNRGTSGIDGSLSTAAGYALASPDKKVICILGDISFLYDSNALWTNSIPPNLNIIILNNQGGKIFEFIDGPSKENRLDAFIKTPHSYTAQQIANHYNIPYYLLNHHHPETIFGLLEKNETNIIEINTTSHG